MLFVVEIFLEVLVAGNSMPTFRLERGCDNDGNAIVDGAEVATWEDCPGEKQLDTRSWTIYYRWRRSYNPVPPGKSLRQAPTKLLVYQLLGNG